MNQYTKKSLIVRLGPMERSSVSHLKDLECGNTMGHPLMTEMLHTNAPRRNVYQNSGSGTNMIHGHVHQNSDFLRDFGLTEEEVDPFGNCQFLSVAHQWLLLDRLRDNVFAPISDQESDTLTTNIWPRNVIPCDTCFLVCFRRPVHLGTL